MSRNAPDATHQVFKSLARLAQAALVYPLGSDRQVRSAAALADSLALMGRTFHLTLLGDEAVVEGTELIDFTPVEALLLKAMHRAGWESLRLGAKLSAAEAQNLAAALSIAKRPPLSGPEWAVGFLNLESGRRDDERISNAAVGYLKLLADSREAFGAVASGDGAGVELAREVVAGITSHLEAGTDIFQSVRNLKRYDDYTFTHALNVSMLATAFGRQMGAGSETLEALGVAGLFHDVGKTRVPHDILNKPGMLEPAEKAIMDRHPIDSARIILKLDPQPHPLVAVVAYQHHMLTDGTGYPARLAGQLVHPASQLLSVADVFDAVRTDRPYSKALTPEKAVNLILARSRQGHFNRGAVSVLAKLSGMTLKGKRVTLTNGMEATVQVENLSLPLNPKVLTDLGVMIDLNSDRTVGIAAFAL